MPTDNHSVVLSVSGLVLSLNRKQLNRYPNTRLAQQFLHSKSSSSNAHTLMTIEMSREMAARASSSLGHHSQHATNNATKDAPLGGNVVVYFFNRNPLIFMHIVDFYRTGMLHFPHQYCWTVIADELDYWQIDSSYLAECCQTIYNDNKRRVERFREMQHIFGDDVRRFQSAVMTNENVGRFSGVRRVIAQFYNDPAASKMLRVRTYFIFYIAIVLIYLISYILQTESAFREERDVNDLELCAEYRPWLNRTLQSKSKAVWQPKKNSTLSVDTMPKYAKFFTSTPKLILQIIDGMCTVVFAVDLVLRYIGSINTRAFFANSGHVIDLMCNISDLIALSLHVSKAANFSCNIAVLVIYLLLEVSRVIRIMRLIQFTNRYNSIIVLILTLRSSIRELLLLLAVLGAGVVIFGFLIFVAELSESENSQFDNFMVGFWWAIVTMTTVGYGDVVPSTSAGYIIGSGCAITGVIFVALQVPVIANKFNALYTYACDQQLRDQWKNEVDISTGEVTMATTQQSPPPPRNNNNNKRFDYSLEDDNPVAVFKRQLQLMPTYSTPASFVIFPQNNKK